MDWDLLDFAVFGAMVLGVVVIGLLARRASRSSLYRLGVGVAVVALIGDLGTAGPSWPADILVLTLFFVFLWLLSAWLFKQSARRHYAGKHDLRG